MFSCYQSVSEFLMQQLQYKHARWAMVAVTFGEIFRYCTTLVETSTLDTPRIKLELTANGNGPMCQWSDISSVQFSSPPHTPTINWLLEIVSVGLISLYERTFYLPVCFCFHCMYYCFCLCCYVLSVLYAECSNAINTHTYAYVYSYRYFYIIRLQFIEQLKKTAAPLYSFVLSAHYIPTTCIKHIL